MLMTAITDQAKLLSNGDTIGVNPPWFANRLPCIFTTGSNKTIHAPVEMRGLQIVALGEGYIRTMLPVLALAWPLNGIANIRTAMLSNEQQRVK